jgi:hypothetical protein
VSSEENSVEIASAGSLKKSSKMTLIIGILMIATLYSPAGTIDFGGKKQKSPGY